MTKYLIDANVFIQAKNLHYGFDFCPAFWEWLTEQNRVGRVASIEEVADELHAVADELSDWTSARGDGFFLRSDRRVLSALPIVSDWANRSGYQAAAVATFLQVADYWLVAHALAHGCTVVTHEVPAATTRKIKIPNACIGLDVPCVSPYQMLRRERARFVLGPSGGPGR